MAMKVDLGKCTACGAKNSKFVEKCYKCHALLPWAANYRPPAPQPQSAPTQLVTPATPAPSVPATPPRPTPSPAFDPLTPPPARTVMYPDAATPVVESPSLPAAPPPYQGDSAPPPYPGTNSLGPIGPMICQTCGYSGHAQTFREGATAIGVVLCLLWLVPGIIYFIWQSSTKYEGCPQCKSRALVPLHSPQGQFSAGHFYEN